METILARDTLLQTLWQSYCLSDALDRIAMLPRFGKERVGQTVRNGKVPFASRKVQRQLLQAQLLRTIFQHVVPVGKVPRSAIRG